jgi:hypothetical protein
MPTAADMAQLGSEIVDGHRTRRAEIAELRAVTRAETKQNIKAMRQVHRDNQACKAEVVHTLRALHDEMAREFQGLDKARREGAREHATQTGHMLGEFQGLDKARREGAREHATQTGHMLGEFQEMDRARHDEAKQHAKETGQHVRHLHQVTRRRRQLIPRRKAEVARMTGGLQRGDAARQDEVREHAAQVRGQMSGYAAEMKGAHDEWRRQMKASTAIRRASARRAR